MTCINTQRTVYMKVCLFCHKHLHMYIVYVDMSKRHFMSSFSTLGTCTTYSLLYSTKLLLIWHVPPGVCCAKRRHQSKRRVNDSQPCQLLYSGRGHWISDLANPHCMRVSWWSPPILRGGSW